MNKSIIILGIILALSGFLIYMIVLGIERTLNIITETITTIIQQLIYFFIPQILFLIFVKRERVGSKDKYKFRLRRVKNHLHLIPFAKTWVVGIIAFFIYIFSVPIFDRLLGTSIRYFLISLGLLKLLPLIAFMMLFNLLLIVYYIFGKKIDKTAGILISIMIISFFIFLVPYI